MQGKLLLLYGSHLHPGCPGVLFSAWRWAGFGAFAFFTPLKGAQVHLGADQVGVFRALFSGQMTAGT